MTSSNQADAHEDLRWALQPMVDDYVGQWRAVTSLVTLTQQPASSNKDERGVALISPPTLVGQYLAPEHYPAFTNALIRVAKALLNTEHGSIHIDLNGEHPDVVYALDRCVISIAKGIRQPTPKALIHQSMLSLMVGNFDALARHLTVALLRRIPALLDAPQVPPLTFQDLSQVTSVEEARTLLEHRYADFLLRDRSKWRKWFTSSAGINWRGSVNLWASIDEIIERRNVYVHAQGKTTEQYARKHSTESPPGSTIPIDDAYLQDAGRRLLIAGVTLAGRAWWQLEGRNPVSGHCSIEWVSHLCNELLEKEEYAAALGLTIGFLREPQHAKTSTTALDNLRVASWTARKMIDKEDSDLYAAVDSWRPSTPRHEVARLLLLGKHAEAHPLVETLMAERRLSVLEMRMQPMYREYLSMREHPEPVVPNGVESLSAYLKVSVPNPFVVMNGVENDERD